MTKEQALKLIDDHKNNLINPVEMLKWSWLRLIIHKMSEKDWQKSFERALEEME